MNKKVIYVVIAIIVLIAVIGVVFIFSNNNSKVEIDLATLNEEIKQKGGFDQMSTMTIDKTTATSLYEIEEGQIAGIIGEMPMMNVHASMYVVIKATEGNTETVKTKIETYAQNYEQQWERYLPEQYDLVKNRKIGTVGDYVYMIICQNAEEVETLIKK